MAATIGLALGAALAGMWFGEDGASPGRAFIFAASISAAAGVLAFLACGASRLPGRLFVGIAVCGLGPGGFGVGARDAAAAFNECVERGEDVRIRLHDYRARSGHYPDSLAALTGAPLPCRRLLRGDLLSYRATATGYSLVFSDWLVEHVATESHGFQPHK